MKIKQAPLSKFVKINPEGITQGYPYQAIEYIDISSVGSGQLVEQPEEILLKDAPSRAKRIVRNKDIILATVRPNLRSFLFIKNPNDNTIVSTGFAVLRTKESSDSRFIYYAITDSRFTGYLTNNTKGTSYPAVDSDIVLRGDIPDFDFKRQQYIGDILSSYDDLIDINRRRIQLLEETARLLFREWFVHFRFPGHEKVKIIDGAPEGWGKVPFSELVDFKEGPGLRNHQFRDEGIPFLNIRTFGDDEIDLSKVGYLDGTEVYEKYKHFLLKEDDHVISSSGTLGRLVTIRDSHLPLMLNTSLIRMRPKQPMKKWMLKAYLLYGGFIEKSSSLAIGAAQLNFGPAHLNKMRILLPKNGIIDKFEKHISVIYLAKKTLLDQNQKLAQARELLLPRLMSGAIDPIR